MNKLIAILVLIAATAQAQLVMRWDGNTRTGPMQLPRTAQTLLDGGGTVSSLAGADWATRNRCGYYEAVRTTAEPGMVITGTAWPSVPTANVFRETITAQITQAEYDAQQAAQEAERLSTPIIYDQPLQARIEIPASDGHVYGAEVDPDTGDVIGVQRQSKRLTEAEYTEARDARMAERQQHRDRIAAISTDLDQVSAAIDALDLNNSGGMGVAIAATTGTTKTALKAVQSSLQDIKTALKNLQQATAKVRREIK